MALVNIPSAPTPPPKPTLEQVKNILIDKNTKMWTDLNNDHRAGFTYFWRNPHYSPRQILESFGTEAKAIFDLSAMAQTMLKTANPDYEILMPFEAFEFNEDGSVKDAVNPLIGGNNG